MRRLVSFVRQFPSLRVFPRNIHRVIEVPQQTFTAIEKAEAEEVVVEERSGRPQDDVECAEPHASLSDNHLRTQRREEVHVVEIVSERGVGVVQKSAAEATGWAIELNVLMNHPVFESASAAT